MCIAPGLIRWHGCKAGRVPQARTRTDLAAEALVGEGEPQAQVDKERADRALEPRDGAASHRIAHLRRAPCTEEDQQRRVEGEDKAEKEKSERLHLGIVF